MTTDAASTRCPMAIRCIPGLPLCPECEARLRAAVEAVRACGLPVGALVLSKSPTAKIVASTRQDVRDLRFMLRDRESREAAAVALAALDALVAA